MTYVVDTNIINRLLDGRIQPEDLPADGPLLATHVQIDELNRTPDNDRRARLFLKFSAMKHELVPTESFVAGVSRVGNAKVSSDHLYTRMKDQLAKRDRRWRNNAHDAQIAEVAIKNGYTLLTADKHLAEVAEKNGCKVQLYAP